MGLFSWLATNRTVKAAPDVIWLTRQARRAGIASKLRELPGSMGTRQAILLVAHFPDQLGELESIASQENNRDWTAVVLASDIDGLDIVAALDASHHVEILVAERHPLRTRDDRIVEFAGRLPCPSRITFHLSLEDALLRAYSGEWIKNILCKLGMRENDPIESALVSRRLRAAQRKIASLVGRELPAQSAEEWLELNMRQG